VYISLFFLKNGPSGNTNNSNKCIIIPGVVYESEKYSFWTPQATLIIPLNELVLDGESLCPREVYFMNTKSL
jgi:hypothetical protein